MGFQLSINWVYKLCYRNQASGSFLRFAGISFAVIVVTSLIAGWLLNSFCPEAAGSGIPQAKLAFWKEFGYAPKRIAWIKFLAGVLSIGGGQSLGGKDLRFKSAAIWRPPSPVFWECQNNTVAPPTPPVPPAGLAAAFNAPLASVAFVLEEIIGDLNSSFIGGILLAAVIGAFVVHACIGSQPAFELFRINEPTWRAYLLMPVAAALAAFVGVYFQRACLGLREKSAKHRVFPSGFTRWEAA